MFVMSFSTKFRGHMFNSFKLISVLQKKRDGKKVNKRKNKVMTQNLEGCVFLFISNASLVPFLI